MGERVVAAGGPPPSSTATSAHQSGKVSARWAITDQIALRGTLSTGFRAPSAAAAVLPVHGDQLISVPGVGTVPFDIRTFRVNDRRRSRWAPSASREESRNASLGMVVQPFDGLYITVDAYPSASRTGSRRCRRPSSAAVRNTSTTTASGCPAGGRILHQCHRHHHRWVDVIATWNMKFGNGASTGPPVTIQHKTEIDRIRGEPRGVGGDRPDGGFSDARSGGSTHGRAPREKFFLGGCGHACAWTFGPNATRFGRFSVLGATPAMDQTFAAKWTLDLSATGLIAGTSRWAPTTCWMSTPTR